MLRSSVAVSRIVFAALVFIAFAASVPVARADTAPADFQTGMLPADNSDLALVIAKAQQVKAAVADCPNCKCPTVDCAAKQKALQDLVNLETYLNELLRALNAADSAAAVHHATLSGQTGITQVNLTNAQNAILLHQTLHNIGSAILDLMSVVDFLENWKELHTKSGPEFISGYYEAMKDGESLMTNLLQNLTGFKEEIKISQGIAPGVLQGLIDAGFLPKGATTDKLVENINDLISQVTDAVNIIREMKKIYDENKDDVKKLKEALKQGRSGMARGVGQMVGRIAKAVSTRVLEERKEQAKQKAEALAAETGTAIAFYGEWMKIHTRRSMAERALEEVRTAKQALLACLTRWCGSTSISRPSVGDYTRSYQGRTIYNWGVAMRELTRLVADTARELDPGATIVDGPCPQNWTDPHATWSFPPGIGLELAEVPYNLRRTAKCPACRAHAEKYNALIGRKLFVVAEIEAIMADLDRALQLSIERNRLLREADAMNKAIQKIQREIENSTFGNAERRVDIAAKQQDLGALLARIGGLRQEIDRLRSREAELGTLDKELLELNGLIDKAGLDLALCEGHNCKDALGDGTGLQRSAEDVIDFGGGVRFGGLLFDFAPSLGKPHTGLFTGDLGRVTLGDDKATFTAYGQLNFAFIDIDNGNPFTDNQYFATNGAATNYLGIGLDYDWRPDFKLGGKLSMTFAVDRTDINNDFYEEAGCDEREPEHRKFCIYDANLYLHSPTLGRLTLGYQESGFGGLGSINLGGTAFVTNNDPTIKVGNHEVFGTGWQFGQIAPDVTGVTRGPAVRYDSPTFAGFALSGSWGEADHAGAPQDAEEYWDVALRYAGEFGGFRVAGGLGYQQYDRENDDWNQGNVTGTGSVLHVPTGLYATGSYSGLFRDAPFAVGAGESDFADAFYLQGGIGQTWWPCLGRTTLFGETGFSYGGGNAGAFFEEATETSNYGIGVVQNIDRAALSLYTTYNRVDGEVGASDGEDIGVFMFGGRLRF